VVAQEKPGTGETEGQEEEEVMEEIDVSSLQVSGGEQKDAEKQEADGLDSVTEEGSRDPFADPEESGAQKGEGKSVDAEPGQGKEHEEKMEDVRGAAGEAESEEVPLAVDPDVKVEMAEEKKG